MRAILPICVVVLLVLAGSARAAPYRVYACDGPRGEPLSMRPFEPFAYPYGAALHRDRCLEAENVAYVEWSSALALGDGHAGGWTLTAPAGTSLTQLRWSGWAAGIYAPGVRGEIAGDRGLVAVWTEFLAPATRTFSLPAGTAFVALRQACRGPLCVAAGTTPAITAVTALEATLDDAAPPVATGLAGALAEGARPLHGGAQLTFLATDQGAGLARAALTADGAEVDTVALGRCSPLPGDARGYRSTQPCAGSAAVALAWDTARVPDGGHVVSAVVEDAAGNARTMLGPVAVTTDNAPPLAGRVTLAGDRRVGATLTATAADFAGQDVAYTYRWQRCDGACEDAGAGRTYALTAADAGLHVRALVTATDLGGATTVASESAAIEPATTAPAPTPPRVLRVTTARRSIRSTYGKRVEIAGRVADTRGRPIAGATVDVTDGASQTSTGTGRSGRFTYVAPAGPGRDVRFSAGGGTATTTLVVRAAGTLRAARHGRVVTLQGRVYGGHVPPGGVLIAIAGGRRTLLTRTDADGAFAARWVTARRLSFRATARKDSAWPYAASPIGRRVTA